MGKMNRMSMKRIITDILNITKDPIDDIYISYSEADISVIKALVVGPRDTPYEGGFYMFKIKFPKDYPHKPPHVDFLTTDRYIRLILIYINAVKYVYLYWVHGVVHHGQV